MNTPSQPNDSTGDVPAPPANSPGEATSSSGLKPSHSGEYVVRYGATRMLGVMESELAYRYGDSVVVRTERGTELGTVLCEATPAAIDAIVEATQGRILRAVSGDDRARRAGLDRRVSTDMAAAERHVRQIGLPMQLVDIERLFGGEQVVVYFMAEGRVDFRRLVRELAKHFRTKVQMRQIGVRDEAKLVADYGDCGRPICCANHLTKMPPVSMRMAKLQKATLDPAKISGRCGRLKCCLRYEFETYESYAAELPPIGSQILTRDGSAKVVAQDILGQRIAVQTEDRRRILIGADEVVSVTRRGNGNAAPA